MNLNPSLEIKNLSFSYGNVPILENISFSVLTGHCIAIVGPSGFGKSTLLQLIAGDLVPTSGTIKKVGMWRRVFQQNALLPWLTVEENIKLGLRGIPPERSLDYKTLIKLLDLNNCLTFYPRQLSGGQAQRADIARAIIGRPDGLLLDEPFSSLDYLIRHETRLYLSSLIKEFPISVILVTHDIPEAVAFTHKTFVMNKRPASFVGEYTNETSQPELIEKIWQDLKR